MVTAPRWKSTIRKCSLGACRLSSGSPRPTRRLSAPSASWKVLTTGIDPPSRTNTGRLPNPVSRAFSAALNALDHKQDKFISLALSQAVIALERYWRPALEAGKLKFDKESHREFAEREAGLGFDKRLGSYLKKKTPGLEETRLITKRLISDGTIRQARMVVDSLGQKGAKTSPEVTLVLLEGLAQVGRRGDFSLGQRVSPLKELLHHTDDAVAASAIANLGVWQLKGSDPDLSKILRDDKRAASVRQAAAVSLGLSLIHI